MSDLEAIKAELAGNDRHFRGGRNPNLAELIKK